MSVLSRPTTSTEQVTSAYPGDNLFASNTSGSTAGTSIPLGKVVARLAQFRHLYGTGGTLDPAMVRFRATTGGDTWRIEVLACVPKLRTPAILSPADQVAFVRSSLSLNIKELAQILDVGRPTIYAWTGGEAEPQSENLLRLSALYDFAQNWSTLTGLPMGEDVRRPHFDHGKSIVDLLSEGYPGGQALDEKLEILAQAVESKNHIRKKTSVRAVLAARGMEQSGSSETLDMLTGKRIGDA